MIIATAEVESAARRRESVDHVAAGRSLFISVHGFSNNTENERNDHSQRKRKADTMRFDELEAIGWMRVEGVTTNADLLELGRELGQPTPTPNGEMIKQITVVQSASASAGSQSSIYDTGPFPLHTDTVFWPTPVRYVVLRAHGEDTRRPTTVVSFSRILKECGTRNTTLAERSVWI